MTTFVEFHGDEVTSWVCAWDRVKRYFDVRKPASKVAAIYPKGFTPGTESGKVRFKGSTQVLEFLI